MKKQHNAHMIIALCFLWIGFVCAISFMEAWLKFRADGVTLPIGLSIGKIVFKALNRVEWVLCVSLVALVVTNVSELVHAKNMVFVLVGVILVYQTFWLLPALNTRVELRLKNITPPDSKLHIVFVIAEGLKIILLCIYGVLHFK